MTRTEKVNMNTRHLRTSIGALFIVAVGLAVKAQEHGMLIPRVDGK